MQTLACWIGLQKHMQLGIGKLDMGKVASDLKHSQNTLRFDRGVGCKTHTQQWIAMYEKTEKK